MFQVSTCWTESSDSQSSLRFISKLACIFAGDGGETGLEIMKMILEKDYIGLLNFELSYDREWDKTQLINCRQALAFFQKNDSLDIGVDRKLAALTSFLESEKSCTRSNAIFRTAFYGSFNFEPNVTVILHDTRSLIRKVLGRVPNLGDLRLRFGPGATASIKRERASPCFKLGETPSCSLDLYASGLLPELFRQIPHWLDCHAEDVDFGDGRYSAIEVETVTGKLQFVPKNAKTDRTIDSQPTLNTLVQAGVGDWMMRRLKRFGVDLRDQRPNQLLALQGSIDGQLATIDLRSASDTISYWLVKYLLPDDWFRLLNSCKCSCTTLKGKTILLEKFCSMGNGFTFPLESLLFWALSKSAISFHDRLHAQCSTLSVYGDDIVCPTWAFCEICHLLEVCGFEVNLSKSFVHGKFRESCGSDFYDGINVRPYYCRTVVSARTLFTMHNAFYRNGREDVCKIIRNAIPTSLRLYGPDGYGDGHLVSLDWQPVFRKSQLRKGYGGSNFMTYSLVGRFVPTPYPGDYVTPLYSIYIKGREDGWELSVLEDPTEPVKQLENGRVLWPLPANDGCAYVKKHVYTFER